MSNLHVLDDGNHGVEMENVGTSNAWFSDALAKAHA